MPPPVRYYRQKLDGFFKDQKHNQYHPPLFLIRLIMEMNLYINYSWQINSHFNMH